MTSNELDLGSYFPCLNVKQLDKSIDYYLKLGFKIREDHREDNWMVLQHNNMILSLFQGHIERNLINFRGGDIAAIVAIAKKRGIKFNKPAHIEHDGSWSAETIDPDGNVIYFNTFPDEREKYIKKGTLV
jgi:predicted lactoylglutathione lyase